MCRLGIRRFCFFVGQDSQVAGRREGNKLCRPATKTFAGIKMLRKKSINVMIGECYRKGEDIFYALKKGRTKINAAILFLELSFTMM